MGAGTGTGLHEVAEGRPVQEERKKGTETHKGDGLGAAQPGGWDAWERPSRPVRGRDAEAPSRPSQWVGTAKRTDVRAGAVTVINN